MVKLTTNPPERRPRCLAKAPSRKHVQSRLGEAAAEELRFEDGKIEQYQNRPRSRHPAPVLEPNRQGRTPPLQPQVPFSDTNPDRPGSAAVEAADARFGRIDALVNAAGDTRRAEIDESGLAVRTHVFKFCLDGSTGDGGWASAGASGFARPAVSREGNGTGPNGRIGGD